MFGGKPRDAGLPNNVSFVAIISVLTNSNFHWQIRVSQNITANSKLILMPVYISEFELTICNLRIVNQKLNFVNHF